MSSKRSPLSVVAETSYPMSSKRSQPSAEIWLCAGEEVGESYFFSLEVPYTVKQRPIDDLRSMVPKLIQLNEDDKAFTSFDLYCNAAVAVDGVTYVFISDEFACPSKHHKPSVVFMELKEFLYNLQVAALDRNIYIYGMHRSRPSFQVFDTVTGIFSDLPCHFANDSDNALKLLGIDSHTKRAVFKGNYLRLLGVDTEHKRIMFVSEQGFLFYDVQLKSWPSAMEIDIEIRSSILNSIDRGWFVLVGNRIYWLADTKQIMAYDFGETAYYESKALAKFQGTFSTIRGVGGGLEFDVDQAYLLYIKGDYFCLVWQSMFDNDVLITTLRVSSSMTNKSLTVSLLNTEKYHIDGYHLLLRLALPLHIKEPLENDTIEDLEEFPESPPPPHHFDVPYSIVEHLSRVGDRFTYEVARSFWICGYTGEGEECFFPIDLRVSRPAESREVKRIRQDETVLKPISIETSGLKECVHVALDDKIYNIGGSCDGIRPEYSIKVLNIQDKMKVVSDKSMIKARYGPQVAKLDKRIYIFGGEDDEDMESAEFYDVAKDYGGLLRKGFRSGYRLVGVDRKLGSILFLPANLIYTDGYISSYHCYCTREDRWSEAECELDWFSRYIGDANHVMVGTTLHWVSKHGFHSYDFKERVSGKSRRDRSKINFLDDFDLDYASMFHMYRDVFCVVGLDGNCRYGAVYWMTVSISISNRVCQDGGLLEIDGLNEIDVEVLHADLYTIPAGTSFRYIPALSL